MGLTCVALTYETQGSPTSITTQKKIVLASLLLSFFKPQVLQPLETAIQDAPDISHIAKVRKERTKISELGIMGVVEP